MGISGLLQFIKDAAEPINVKKYKDQTVAVDTYCWLHKGAFSCAEKLAKGEPTNQYVSYCMKFVDMLLTFRVKPILVFDGRNLPSKQEVEKTRRARREANLQKGKQLLREGKLPEARDCFTRCVNITPAMAHNLIKVARARGVDCIVAPYEADAQLAFLTKSGLAQAVITEDSDLLAFGCKKVILKMDKQGNGLEIDQSNLGRCRSLGNAFTEEKFRYMCILSGCDYLASLHGIGLGKACKLLRLTTDPDILKVIRKMGQYLKMNLHIPEQYIEGFIRANNTFLYQLVFDPVARKVIPLNPYPEDMDVAKLSYAGHNPGDDKGLQMAMGNLDINTMERIDDYNPDKAISQHRKSQSQGWDEPAAPTGHSIWSRDLKAESAASPCRSPSTRGEGGVISLRAVRLPCRELQVKRPREDPGVSDQDLLVQYLASSQKRPRSDQPMVTPTVTKPRNRFSTLLQKRNQEEEVEKGPATCSRFFNSFRSVADVSPQEFTQEDSAQRLEARAASPIPSSSLTSQNNDSRVPDMPSVDTPSLAASPSTTPLNAANQDLRLFHWLGNSTSTAGLAALQQFQYKKETSSSSMKTHKSPGTPPLSLSSIAGNEEKLPDSPRSQDSAYFSQPQSDTSSGHKEEVPTSYQNVATSEMTSYDDLELEPSATCLAEAEKKASMFQSRVSGLSRLKSSRHCQVAKVQKLGPARASGLRKKPEGAGRKISSADENRPGQSTISSLWMKFGFKKGQAQAHNFSTT